MIEIIDNIEQGSPEWFLHRCGSLGASRVKDAMAGGKGKSRQTLLYQLVAEEITGIKTEIRQTPAMLHGIETEPEARRVFEFSYGADVQQVALVKNTLYQCMHCSPDGLVGANSGLEIKCPTPAVHARYLDEGRLPPEYKAQVQFSMMICERPSWYFMSFHPAFSRHLVVKVEADKQYIADMRYKLEAFTGDLLLTVNKIEGN